MLFAFGILIICLAAILILASKWSSSRKIDSFSLSGNHIVAKSRLMAYIENIMANENNPKIEADDIRRLLEKNPYIQKAYVTHKNLDELQIRIKERHPIASVILENGQIQYIDSALNLLPFQTGDYVPDVPIIRGVFTDGRLDTVGIVGSLLVLSGIKESGRNYMEEMVSEIIYDNISKCFSLHLASNSSTVLLGDINNLEYKIDKLDAYFKSNPYNLAFPPESIDLRWSNHIVTYSPEQTAPAA